ncbi:MAG TPA: HNH endonuclease signature motif containing protein, partial [Polyangiaceae bacterium]|nr:HNH endonuclease signature motif containing protein [Polyangiaceae bacterium]
MIDITETAQSKGPTVQRPAWQEIHQRVVRVAGAKAALDEEQGRLMLEALRAEVHSYLGYATFVEYMERLFGLGPRETEDRLRVARALEALPLMAGALRRAQLCWSAARELTRVAIPESEESWLEAAAGKTVRQIEALVSGRQHGDLPNDPANADVRRHVLRFEVSADVYALWREAVAQLRHESGGQLDEDDAFLMMARHVLAGPKDPGRSNYQIAVTVCESCGQGFQQGRGESIAVGNEIVEMALCDAQSIGHVGACETHVGRAMNREMRRALQAIPPSVRREIMRRDGGRCAVPGCRCSVFIDVHHIKTVAEGGKHDADLMILLCGKHHKLVHRGALIIEGSVSHGLSFYHADGSVYGHGLLDPCALERFERAFAALRGLGFKDGETKRALAEVRTHVGSRSVTSCV